MLKKNNNNKKAIDFHSMERRRYEEDIYKRRYFEKMLGTKQLPVAIDFHSMKMHWGLLRLSQWLLPTVCFPTFFFKYLPI